MKYFKFIIFITNTFIRGKTIQLELFYHGTLYLNTQYTLEYTKHFKYIWNKDITNNKTTSIIKYHRR